MKKTKRVTKHGRKRARPLLTTKQLPEELLKEITGGLPRVCQSRCGVCQSTGCQSHCAFPSHCIPGGIWG